MTNLTTTTIEISKTDSGYSWTLGDVSEILVGAPSGQSRSISSALEAGMSAVKPAADQFVPTSLKMAGKLADIAVKPGKAGWSERAAEALVARVSAK